MRRLVPLLAALALAAGSLGVPVVADEVESPAANAELTTWIDMGVGSAWNRGGPWVEEELHISGWVALSSITKLRPQRIKVVVKSPQLLRADVTAEVMCWHRGLRLVDFYDLSGGREAVAGTRVTVDLPTTFRVPADWLTGALPNGWQRCTVWVHAAPADSEADAGKIAVRIKAKYAT